ncbi:hypothetical protein AAC387_Pa01g2731 [Persea americana]
MKSGGWLALIEISFALSLQRFISFIYRKQMWYQILKVKLGSFLEAGRWIRDIGLRDKSASLQMEKRHPLESKDHEVRYTLIRDVEEFQGGLYDKPLPCFGCGIGWFSFLLGFVFPLMWCYGTILYFGNYYRKDPRERAGLAASAIAALICSVAVLITIAAVAF